MGQPDEATVPHAGGLGNPLAFDTALRALLAHPLVGGYPTAKAILDDFVAAHDGFLRGARPDLRNPVD